MTLTEDLEHIRSQFPLITSDSGDPIVFLDSAATSLKPKCVIDAVVEVMQQKVANVHRSVHQLGDRATEAFEASRETVADFIGAEPHEVVFVRNTTEALNLVAKCWPEQHQRITSLCGHHSNLLCWTNKAIHLNPSRAGTLDEEELAKTIEQHPNSLVAISHVSNVTGFKVDVAKVADWCHRNGSTLVVDAAQSAPHEPIDVVELDCDFLAFSGHKLGGPSGIGVLYGKAENLERLGSFLRGGSMVEEVHVDASFVHKDIPWRLEAGTPAIEAAVGLGAAVDFLSDIGMERVREHHMQLMRYAENAVQDNLKQVDILGPNEGRAGPISMVQRSVSPHLIARGLSDGYAICARSGFHCCQPLHEFLSLPASLRLSFGIHNTFEEVDDSIEAINKLLDVNK